MGLPEDEVRARVDEALEMVRMSDYRERLSHHLSVGEKKRIAIATVLSMRPQILVLDEPSAGTRPARPARPDQPAARLAHHHAGLLARSVDGARAFPAHGHHG